MNFMNTPPLIFTEQQSIEANRRYGANCGPHALAAACQVDILKAVVVIPGFVDKHYTNPTMMQEGIKTLGYNFKRTLQKRHSPLNGIARVQWEGKWLKPGVPKVVAYGYTHWIAGRDGWVFCTVIPVFGWVTFDFWKTVIDAFCVDEKYDGWHITHQYEIEPAKK